MTDSARQMGARQMEARQIGGAAPPISEDLGRKIFFILGIALVTLLAGFSISGLIHEREQRQLETANEFKQNWGPEQQIRGPLLAIPYSLEGDSTRYYYKMAPTELKIAAQLSPETRKRGLFEATVYSASIALEGSFRLPSEAELQLSLPGKKAKFEFAHSFLGLDSNSLEGMRATDQFNWQGQPLAWQDCSAAIAGAGNQCTSGSFLIGAVQYDPQGSGERPAHFRATLTLRGTSSFAIAPSARSVDIAISSPWQTPSYLGNTLPESSKLDAQGFSAHWQWLEYSGPKSWTSTVSQFPRDEQHLVKVALLEATPIYRMIHRVSKYQALFVALSFTTFLLFELLSGVRIHVVQYGLLGCSVTLFALLLLAFGEFIGYSPAYLLSALLILAQASAYAGSVAGKWRVGAMFAAVLGALFGFLFVVLGMEAYALLLGATALFLVLSVIMVITQRINWTGNARAAS